MSATATLLRRLLIIVAGAAVGFFETVVIYFLPGQEYPGLIIVAGIIRGALVALLIASFIDSSSSLRSAVITGGMIGLAFAAVVFLSRGGWVTWKATWVVPAGLGSGALLGAVVRGMNRRPAV